jgi:hypothetical protein
MVSREIWIRAILMLFEKLTRTFFIQIAIETILYYLY